MLRRLVFIKYFSQAVLTITMMALFSCNGDLATHKIPPTNLELTMPNAYGNLDRPAVEFRHGKHTKALAKEGCGECHLKNEQGDFVFKFKRLTDPTDFESLTNLYHDNCNGCHKKHPDKITPVACAQCHAKKPPSVSERVPLHFDYSLHARHSKASDDKCETCHHVYNEQKKLLEYQKGQENACRDCHGERDVGKNLSLANASHTDCINCHLAREKEGNKTGPSLCVGCHQSEKQQKIAKLKQIPRLKRGQPDIAWIKTEGGKSPMVAFNHLGHEQATNSCSDCHHQTVKPCKDCHTLTGTKEGDGITLAVAFHDNRSEHSCVGCHERTAKANECSGCHHTINHTPRERSCTRCHNGPLPTTTSDSLPAPKIAKINLPALPPISDDFPKEVIIDRIVKDYQASTFPHQKIVQKLYSSIKNSKLAVHFHQNNDALCAGCHHQAPVGTRPVPCSSCHADTHDATMDKPNLMAAYHRQCIECHQEMNLKTVGCTDCHAQATKEIIK